MAKNKSSDETGGERAAAGLSDERMNPVVFRPLYGREVYAQMSAAMADFAKAGLAKTRENKAQHFHFRGVDELMNLAAPILVAHKLLVLPRVLSRTVEARTTKSDTLMFNVALDVEFAFVSATDGSLHVVRVAGEAQDSGDKATNKAMAAAFKYALFQSFCIPLEGGGEDADASTPEETAVPAPEGYDVVKHDAKDAALAGTLALRAYAREAFKAGRQAAWSHLVERDAEWADIKATAERVDAATAARIAADVKQTGTRVPGEEG